MQWMQSSPPPMSSPTTPLFSPYDDTSSQICPNIHPHHYWHLFQSPTAPHDAPLDLETSLFYAGWWSMLQWIVVGLLVTYSLQVFYRSIRYKQRAKWSSEVTNF